jgi:hypothetical protein
VVPKSPLAQGSPTEERQQPENHSIEDKDDEEKPPPSNMENEKMYRDADEVEFLEAPKLWSPPACFELCWNT